MSDQIRTDNSAVIERLERERDELAAQVERLRSELEEMVEVVDSDRMNDCTRDAHKTLNETPAQSLREIRAEAGREGYRRGWVSGRENRMPHGLQDGWGIPNQESKKYAQQIREGKE